MAKSGMLVFVLGVLLISTLPMPTSAEDSGGVQASSSTVFIQAPGGTAIEGGSATIRLTLWNDNIADADDVLYEFYWNGVSPSKLMEANTVDIPGQTSVDVDVIKSGLTVGEHKVWIRFEYDNAGMQTFYKEFTVMGRPNLEVDQISYSPVENLHSGDLVEISSLVSNSGSENASASRMQIKLGTVTEILDVPPISNGNSTWMNKSIAAPASGDYTIEVTVDLDDAIVESDEDNIFTEDLVVSPRMDLSHYGDVTVETPVGSMEGPWTFTGTLLRTGGSGNTTVPMKLEISDGNGGILSIAPFDVNISGGSSVQTEWSYVLEYGSVSNIATGSHSATVVIDPFGSAPFEQESEENDRYTAYFEKLEIPDVVVDPIAVPSTGVIDGGSLVWWNVSITNTAQIDVRGKLVYTWEGVTVEFADEPVISISPGETHVWNKVLQTELGAHTAEFNSHWEPLSDSYDSEFTNSVASGSVTVTSQLQLDLSTMSLLNSDGEAVSPPLMSGDDYVLEISLNSQEIGSVNFTCQDSLGKVWNEISIQITERGQFAQIDCEFTATSPRTNLLIVPDDLNAAETQSWSWDTNVRPEDVIDSQNDAAWGTVTIIGLISLGLIGVLIAAVILTREREEEVERDIFDYCPACDGKLEGGEDRCPHCSFNLKKARRQFHDCESCSESIPDLLSDCPYCGAPQDVSKYFERRERKEIVKETIALPEEELDPEDIHATGYEDFDEAVKEFGYDSDDLEGHWDENIAKAEAEVEAAYDRRIAAEEELEMDDEEAMATVTTTLKSVEETFEGHDIDAFLSEKDEIKSHTDDGSELTASDAEIRGRLFEITGEDGVMPGDEVHVGMGTVDRSLAGNELPEDAMDFSFEDEQIDELNPSRAAIAKANRKRGLRRKKKTKVAECGACGAEIAVDAKECTTCGAKFE